MVYYLKFNLHSLFIAIASVSYVYTKQNLMIVNLIQLQHRLTFATEVCYSCTRQFLLRVLVVNCVRVEHRLSFAAVVVPASGNWKHLLPLKIILVPFPMVTVLEIANT